MAEVFHYLCEKLNYMINHKKGPGLIFKYTWIINKIRGKQLSFAQISDAWERDTDMSRGNPLPKRTFDNWRYAIYDIFRIDIKCNNNAGGGYRYYIDDTSDIDNDELKKWMFNTFSVSSALIHNQSISDRILLEEVPKGDDLLPNILKAMKENHSIKVTHHPYHKKRSYTYTINPYCIKMFRQRWYLVGLITRTGEIHSLALDRIEKLNVLDKKFNLPEDWNSKEFFKNAFGIIANPDARVERVRLKVDASQANYFRSLPLHASQVEEEKNSDFSIFKYKMWPGALDFMQELLKNGATIEVLEPSWLRMDIAEEIKMMYGLYHELTETETETKTEPQSDEDTQNKSTQDSPLGSFVANSHLRADEFFS